MTAQPKSSLRTNITEDELRPRARRTPPDRQTVLLQDAPTNPQEVDIPCGTSERQATELSDLMVAWHDKEFPYVERLRSLRTRLLNSTSQTSARVIGITSALPREGKSVTAANLAVVMAELRHLRVLLIDGHFHDPGIGDLFGLPDSEGLAHVLRDARAWEDAIHSTPMRNLNVLPAGQITADAASTLWGSPNASTIMGRLRQRFHVIIVDTPPALRSADACIIGRLCTEMIMVLKLQETSEESAQRAAQLLHDNLVQMAGCLIIDDDASTTKYEPKRRITSDNAHANRKPKRRSLQEVR
jgi:capsular exopolysaccharide synthesis family protein